MMNLYLDEALDTRLRFNVKSILIFAQICSSIDNSKVTGCVDKEDNFDTS